MKYRQSVYILKYHIAVKKHVKKQKNISFISPWHIQHLDPFVWFDGFRIFPHVFLHDFPHQTTHSRGLSHLVFISFWRAAIPKKIDKQIPYSPNGDLSTFYSLLCGCFFSVNLRERWNEAQEDGEWRPGLIGFDMVRFVDLAIWRFPKMGVPQ